ncbi:MAG: hypothetical protein ACRDD1_18350 [Planctomycetia bacterium]
MPPDDLTTESTTPVPTDPAFLFATLIAARKAGDRLLESLARSWLADLGVRVRFANELDARDAKIGSRPNG